MKGSLGRASFMLLLACGAVAASVHACKEPTQVTVDIRTLGFSCHELKKITVVVAGDPAGAEGKWQYPQAEVGDCQSDTEVGTLVITPSGDHGAVMVLASYTETPCVAPDYVNCIVARRQFSFIENVPLRLPITLEASCKNVPCNALSSCRSGACVSSETDCNDNGTCAAPAEPVVAADGGVVPPSGDATIDIPPNDAFVPPDNFVPPPDGGPDAAPDAPFDAPPDGPKSDGSVSVDSGYGNACPSTGGPNCNPMSLVCCAYQNFYCSQPSNDGGGACTAGAPWYPCTGRAGCPQNNYCCAPAVPVGGSGVASGCAFDPGCAGGVVLCNNSADCPPGMTCGGVPYISRGNGALYKCQ